MSTHKFLFCPTIVKYNWHLRFHKLSPSNLNSAWLFLSRPSLIFITHHIIDNSRKFSFFGAHLIHLSMQFWRFHRFCKTPIKDFGKSKPVVHWCGVSYTQFMLFDAIFTTYYLSGLSFRTIFHDYLSGLSFRSIFQEYHSGLSFRTLFQDYHLGLSFKTIYQYYFSGLSFRTISLDFFRDK